MPVSAQQEKAQLRSLATQISGLTRYVAKQEGWLLTDIYMDVDSAKTGSDRREFTRLLTDCKTMTWIMS